MPGRDTHRGGHVLPTGFHEARRRRAVAGDPEPDHPGTLAVQPLTQRTQTVGGVREPVQQQHARPGCIPWELEAAIPVDRPAHRIGEAAAAVPIDDVLRTSGNLAIDPLVELGEEAFLQGEILLEARDVGFRGELFVQVRVVPDRKVRATLEEVDEDHQARDETARRRGHEELQQKPGGAGESLEPHGAGF